MLAPQNLFYILHELQTQLDLVDPDDLLSLEQTPDDLRDLDLILAYDLGILLLPKMRSASGAPLGWEPFVCLR